MRGVLMTRQNYFVIAILVTHLSASTVFMCVTCFKLPEYYSSIFSIECSALFHISRILKTLMNNNTLKKLNRQRNSRGWAGITQNSLFILYQFMWIRLIELDNLTSILLLSIYLHYWFSDWEFAFYLHTLRISDLF